jgi:hypothetical protein
MTSISNAADFERLLRTLGALVINFNSADHALRRIAWHLLNPADPRVGQIVTDQLSVARLEDLVSSLAETRALPPALSARLSTVLAECREVRRVRNDLVHAVWRVPNEASSVADAEGVKFPTRKTPDYRQVATAGGLQEVLNANARTVKLSTDIEELYTLLAERRS